MLKAGRRSSFPTTTPRRWARPPKSNATGACLARPESATFPSSPERLAKSGLIIVSYCALLLRRRSKAYTKGIGILAGSLRRKLNVQTIGLLSEFEPSVAAEQRDSLNLPFSDRGSQVLDYRLSAGGPTQLNRVQGVASCCKAEIF